MGMPLEIRFRNMDPSPAVEARIREKAAKLERFHDRIISCTVVVEAPHRHQNKGKLYSVHIDISVPGKDHLIVDAPSGRIMPMKMSMSPCAMRSTPRRGGLRITPNGCAAT